MKKGAGKNKGSGFERQICKELSIWWTDGVRDDIFWTTSGSGARSTTRTKCGMATANSAGDVCFLDDVGKPFIDSCVIELKCGYTSDLSVNKLLDGKLKRDPLLVSFWKKLEEERASCGRPFSILIYRRNRRQSVVVVSLEMFSVLELLTGVFPWDYIYCRFGDYRVIMCQYEKFFDFFVPETFKMFMEGWRS